MALMETVCQCGHVEIIHRDIGRYDKARDKYWTIISRCRVPGCTCQNFRVANVREYDPQRRTDR